MWRLDVELQEIFDIVSKHLLKQGRRSLSANNSKCVYRSPDGLKCAAGALISDEEYRPEMDSTLDSGWIVNLHLRKVRERVGNATFVAALQEIHDMKPPDRWALYLRDLAKMHGLTCNF